MDNRVYAMRQLRQRSYTLLSDLRTLVCKVHPQLWAEDPLPSPRIQVIFLSAAFPLSESLGTLTSPAHQ